MSRFLDSMMSEVSQLAEVGGSAFAVVAVSAVAYLLLVRGLKTAERRRLLPTPLVATLRRIGFWIILACAVLLLLQVMGALQSVITAVTGVFALVAIGFVAVWSVLSNTLCSVILMTTRPFRVGDTLSFPPDDLQGKVVNFNLIFTTLRTEDDLLLQVPNNMFFQRAVVRKVGRWKIGLADQLYEAKDATGDRPTPAVENTQDRAA